MKLFRKVAIVAGSGLATIGFASGAWAFFTAGGTAQATTQVGTVAPPTGVTATQTAPDTGTVNVQWVRPTAPGGLPLSGYYVERLVGPTASPACGSSPGALLASAVSDCNDTDVATGSYAYRVTAVYRTWTAASAPATVDVNPAAS